MSLLFDLRSRNEVESSVSGTGGHRQLYNYSDVLTFLLVLIMICFLSQEKRSLSGSGCNSSLMNPNKKMAVIGL